MAEIPDRARPLVATARRDLAGRLGVAEGDIRTASVESKRWRDASLGCPEPGRMYAQVLVDGFVIVLEAGGRRYEFRSDGRRVRLCERA